MSRYGPSPHLLLSFLTVALLLLGPVRPALAQDDRPKSCPDEACFEEAFAACQPAYFNAVQSGAWYEIIEPTGDACRLSLSYERNPNREWVGKKLYFTASPSPSAPLIEAVRQSADACMQGEASDCDGPLYDLVRAEALFPATLQGMERESASKQNRSLAVVANATYLDASTDAQAVLDLMVADASIASLYPTEIHGDQKLVRRLASNPDDLKEITVDDQTAYLEPDDDEGGLVAYVPLDAYAVLTVRQCCGRTEQDLQALIAALDMQEFRSAATAYAEAEHNAELRSVLMAVPPSIAGHPLRTHEIHGESGSYLVELSYPTTDTARDKIEVTIFASASAVPSGELVAAIGSPQKLEQGLAEGLITRTTLAGHDAYLMNTEDHTGFFVTDGAHAFLAVGGPSSVISSEALLEDLTEARIDAFFVGVETIVAE